MSRLKGVFTECRRERNEKTYGRCSQAACKRAWVSPSSVMLGAALVILGNLWVAFFLELIRSFIPQELWNMVSFLGLVTTTVLSIYILAKDMQTAKNYIMGEKRSAKETRKKTV